jgi:hypothetical protein
MAGRKIKTLRPITRLKNQPGPAACSNAHQILGPHKAARSREGVVVVVVADPWQVVTLLLVPLSTPGGGGGGVTGGCLASCPRISTPPSYKGGVRGRSGGRSSAGKNVHPQWGAALH